MYLLKTALLTVKTANRAVHQKVTHQESLEAQEVIRIMNPEAAPAPEAMTRTQWLYPLMNPER